MLKEYFPVASLLVAGISLALGNASLFIMSLAAVIGFIPLIYGRDVAQVVRAIAARRDDRD